MIAPAPRRVASGSSPAWRKAAITHPFAAKRDLLLFVSLEELMVTPVPITQEKSPMILSISGVVLLGVICFLFFRRGGLKVSHGLVCTLFGFYLASTTIAPSIRAGGAGLANLIGGLRI
jgi:hypothetical protein